MSTLNRLAVLGLAVLAAAGLTATGIAYSTGRFAPPTAVATINLNRVLEGLSQRAQAEQKVAEMKQQMDAEATTREGTLREMQEGLADLTGVSRRTGEDELAMMILQYQAWHKVSVQQLDLESSLQLRGLYKSIVLAVQALAEAQGYDLVVVDDSSSEFTVNPNSNMSRQLQVRQQIVSRRMLYGRKAIDLTDELIVRMNNAWDANR